MEGYGGALRGYWKRRSYVRLGGDGSHSPYRSRRSRRVKLARSTPSSARGRTRFWRVRVSPKLRLLRRVVSSPIRLLARIRDAYVNMMLRVASSGAFAGAGFGGEIGGGFSRAAGKEYDEKVLVEIYRSLVAQGQILVTSGKDGVPTAQIVSARR